jgi:hypothetical protein
MTHPADTDITTDATTPTPDDQVVIDDGRVLTPPPQDMSICTSAPPEDELELVPFAHVMASVYDATIGPPQEIAPLLEGAIHINSEELQESTEESLDKSIEIENIATTEEATPKRKGRVGMPRDIPLCDIWTKFDEDVISTTRPHGPKAWQDATKATLALHCAHIFYRYIRGESLTHFLMRDYGIDMRQWRALIDANPALKTMRSKAHDDRLEVLLEEIRDIADDRRNDFVTDKYGSPILNREAVQRSDIRIKQRQWEISRIMVRKAYSLGVATKTPTARLEALSRKVWSGDMTIEEATVCLDLMAKETEVREKVEVVERLEKIEALIASKV